MNRLIDLFRRPALQVFTSDTLDADAFRRHKVVYGRLRQIRECLRQASPDGLVLEFGVHKGTSLNEIAQHVAPKPVYGFDSFEGLPSAWQRDKDGRDIYPKGHFGLDHMPDFESNVVPVKGWIEETLPEFLAKIGKGQISFLHIDVDIYSTAKFILTELNQRMVPGTIVVFDELMDFQKAPVYTNWQAHEWRALSEWLSESGREVQLLSRSRHWAAAIKVVR